LHSIEHHDKIRSKMLHVKIIRISIKKKRTNGLNCDSCLSQLETLAHFKPPARMKVFEGWLGDSYIVRLDTLFCVLVYNIFIDLCYRNNIVKCHTIQIWNFSLFSSFPNGTFHSYTCFVNCASGCEILIANPIVNLVAKLPLTPF
jgi:hypothetical protein